MKVLFHGAVRTVTGSLHEVQTAGRRIVLDCGLFQGKRQEARERNSRFDFRPDTVDAVILSHAHIDHCGNLPNLVKQGYQGPIYATKATAAIASLMLLDTARIQEEDAAYLNQKTVKTWKGRVEPLYTTEDAKRTIGLFRPVAYRTPTTIADAVVELRDAGHVLGSAAVKIVEASDGINGRKPTLVFTGDVGRKDSPVVRDPDPFDAADVVLSECTYGGRRHEPIDGLQAELARIIGETTARNGWTIIPAFALGRVQALVQQIHQLRDGGKLPASLPIFVDSPLATRVTEVFRNNADLWDAETRGLVEPFDFPNLTYVGTPDESKALNFRKGPGVIIASSGMCEAGRVLHHLKHHLGHANDTVLLAGYQAANTLGRKIQDRWRQVPILGDMIPVHCRVEMMDGLSAHADGKELVDYVAAMRAGCPRVYLVHGEMEAATAHQKDLLAAGFGQVEIAERGEVVEV